MIAAAASGSLAAREEFVALYGAFIRQQLAARWHGTALLAHIDDAQQEVFVECLKHDGVLARADREVPEGFRALLGAVVRNVALRAETQRQRQRVREAQEPPTQLPAPASTIGRAMDRQWAMGQLRAAAAEQARWAMSIGEPAQRRVELLRLHFEEGRSIPEIAALWGREPGYVHHQYAKARTDFQRALLAVLAARQPDLPESQLREQCRQLAQLLHGR